jgi:hypothetical protein
VRPKDVGAPHIEPPCPACVKVRRDSGGREFWCPEHRERHGQRHSYLASDNPAEDGTLKRVLTER